MAEEKLQYTLTLATRATGTGAKDTAADLLKVKRAATEAADQARYAGMGVATLSNEAKTGGKNIGNMGMLANQASFQIGDFFTQVEMGTSAVRAFSQQAPQMLGALQMAGVMSGPATLAVAGIGAAIPIATIALSGLSKMFTSSAVASDDMAARIKTNAETSAESLGKILDAQFDAIKKSQEQDDARKQNWTARDAAKDQAATAAIESADKLHEVSVRVNSQLGISENSYDKIADANARAQRSAELANDEAQRAEKAKVEALQKTQDALGEVWNKQYASVVTVNEQLQAEREKLKVIQAQKKDLAEIAGRDPGMMRIAYLQATGTDPGLLASQKDLHRKANDAREQLANDGTEEETKNRIKKLQERLASYEAELAQSGNATEKAVNALEDQKAAADEQIARLQQLLQDDNKVRFIEFMEQMASARGDEMAKAAEGLHATNEAGAKIIGDINNIVAGGVQANELPALQQTMLAVQAGLRSGVIEMNGSMRSLLELTASMSIQMASQKAQIEAMKRTVDKMNATSGSQLPQR